MKLNLFKKGKTELDYSVYVRLFTDRGFKELE